MTVEVMLRANTITTYLKEGWIVEIEAPVEPEDDGLGHAHLSDSLPTVLRELKATFAEEPDKHEQLMSTFKPAEKPEAPKLVKKAEPKSKPKPKKTEAKPKPTPPTPPKLKVETQTAKVVSSKLERTSPVLDAVLNEVSNDEGVDDVLSTRIKKVVRKVR